MNPMRMGFFYYICFTYIYAMSEDIRIYRGLEYSPLVHPLNLVAGEVLYRLTLGDDEDRLPIECRVTEYGAVNNGGLDLYCVEVEQFYPQEMIDAVAIKFGEAEAMKRVAEQRFDKLSYHCLYRLIKK